MVDAGVVGIVVVVAACRPVYLNEFMYVFLIFIIIQFRLV